MDLSEVIDNVYQQVVQSNRQWLVDGRLCNPTHDDVARIVTVMVDDVKGLGYDSIETGGVLVRKDGNKIDFFVHIGEVDNK